MANEKIEVLKIEYIFPEKKRPYFKIGFAGGMYLEDTPTDAANRVKEILGFLARSIEIDRLPRRK